MKKIYIAVFFTAMLSLVSCQDFLEGTNENPNDPTNVEASILLAPIQTSLAYEYGGNFSRLSSIFVQQVEGISRQWSGFNNYEITATVFDTDWKLLYTDILQNNEILINQSEANGYNHYVGVGKTIKAFTLLLMTDYFNKIPYTEALTGTAILQPVYDDQAEIYEEVHNLLTEARASLNSSDGGVELSGDFIYSGDTDLWIKATYAIEARAYLHQSLLDSNNYTNALNAIASSFSSTDEEMTFDFVDGATTAGPWYQFNRDRAGDIGFNPTMETILTNYADPRLSIYDDGEVAFSSDHEYFTQNRSLPLVSYTELMFIKAEALLQTGGSQTDIQEAYLAGIESSFTKLSLETTDYQTYSAQSLVTPASVSLEDIITQKWIALYTDPEAFSDWRRTGYPVLTPNNGVAIPTRFLYPQTEVDLNTNVPDVLLTDKVDWDTN